jgi:predicted MFS family arabinose efflux permease
MTEQAMHVPKVAAKPPSYAWVILVVVFLASVAAPLNQFKVPPIMPVLIEAFKMNIASAGWLMSIFAVTGFLLAIPAGFIMMRFGPKTTGLLSMGFVIAGSLIGTFSSTASVMLVSRFIEGMGMGLIAVVAPAAISMWFPAETRGVPMGLWATWVPIGSIIMFNLAPALTAASGWQAVWWAGTIFALVAFVLYLALFRMPKAEEMAGGPPPGGAEAGGPPNLGKAMANSSLWLVSLEFMCFNAVFLALNSFYPTFLNSVRGYDLGSASFLASLMMIMTIFSAPLGGFVSDKINSRKLVIVVPFIIVALFFLVPFNVTGGLIPILMITMGILAGPIPTATFATVPEVMAKPQLVGIGMAVLALGQNLGMFIGPTIFGILVASMGWVTAGYIMIPICLVGIIAGWLVKVR